MKNQEERRQRFALTMLFSFLVFCIILVTVAVAAVLMYLLQLAGVAVDEGGSPEFLPLMLFTGLISLIVGFAFTALTSKFSLKPVNRVINRMNRLAAGDFKARLRFGKPIASHPTFVEIEDSFNKMAEALDSTEMLRADFINNFSHEFKTPIVSIAGFAKLLRRGNLTDAQREEYLAIIEEESLRLSSMATNVLNLTKVENQTILTDVTRFNLSEQIRASILLLEPKWSRMDVGFNIDAAECEITANEELLKQVWINLLDNAIKFSPEGGTVDLRVADRGGRIAVSVLNRGSEIPPEQQSRIFNKFYQADESHSSEGNGIGLALVKGIVELHRGTVSVESGGGETTFTVELPKTAQ